HGEWYLAYNCCLRLTALRSLLFSDVSSRKTFCFFRCFATWAPRVVGLPPFLWAAFLALAIAIYTEKTKGKGENIRKRNDRGVEEKLRLLQRELFVRRKGRCPGVCWQAPSRAA